MREIKFRAWDKDAEEMVLENPYRRVRLPLSLHSYLETHPHCEIMQFTGLLDKQDEEIYESDYLMSDKGLHMTVFWSNERACYSVRFLNIWGKRTDKFFYKSLQWASSRSRVVGNICEDD